MRIFTKSLLLICFCLLSTQIFAQPTANFTATPIVGCAPLLVQFTSTSTGNPTSYQWNLGNSATSVLANPSTTYTTPGTYTVTLTVSNSNGSNTKTVTNYITVYGAPIVSFSANDTADCPPLLANFTNTSNPVTPGAATYNWSFGDGNVSNLQNPSHNYPYPGYYNVTLVVTNSGGCVASLTKPNYIHVYTPPVADFTASNTNNCNTPASVSFTPTITGSGPYTYSWNYGDGGTGTGANPSHSYTTAGIYTVSLIVTDVHGCKDTMVKPSYVSVGTLTAAFNTNPTSGCVNTPINFNNNSIGATSNYWDFDDGTNTTGTNPSHVYTTAGVYNVKLIVYNGNCSDSLTIPVTINPKPTASFDYLPNPPCPAPVNIQFNNSSTGGTSYYWVFGDGGTSNSMNPNHTYNAAGIYSPELIVTGANGCKDTIIKQDSLIFYPLDLAAGAVPVQGCVPLEVHFSSQTYTTIPSNGALYPYATSVWNWDFGDGGTSTLDTPIHTYTTAGTYTVTLTITTINGCTDIDSFQIHVGILPTAGFTVSPDTICNHGTVYFTNTSINATSYNWDFGDGSATGATNPSHLYTVSGIYTIILTAYNNGCPDTFKMDSVVTVHPPTANFYPKYSCDTPLMVKFVDTATIEATSRHWDFGDGNTSTAISPIHTYSTLGNYTVTLITYNNIYGCTDTMTTIIQLIDPHLSFITPDTAICKGDSITFVPTYTGTPATTYEWYINYWGYTDTSYGQWGYRYNQTGIYNMAVRVMDTHNCWDTAKRNNYIHVSKPTAAFSALPPVGCVPLSVLFTDTSHNIPGAYSVTRVWDFGNGTSTVNTASTNHMYNAAGLYDVTLIVTDNVGCSDTLTKPQYIDARKPIASFHANDTTLCIGQTAQFTNTSVGTSLSAVWDFGDGGTSTAFTTTHSYAATGNYTVKLIVTDPSGCKDSITKVSYINVSKPNAAFSMSDTFAICPPLNVLFTNTTTGAITYAWDFGNSSSSTLQNPSAIYTNPGVYNIQLIVTSNQGCKDTAYGTANVLGYAGGLSYTPLNGCAPLDVLFTANLTNVPSIIWDFSDGVTIPANGSSTTTHTYTTPGAYVPKLILSDGAGCLNSSQGVDTIKVDGILSGFITSPACVNTPIQFQDTSFSFFSPISTWLWNFSNGQQISTVNNPTFQYNSPGNYSVSLIVTNAHGCSDTLQKNITIYPLPIVSAGLDTSVCSGDVAQLMGSGAVSYVWTPATGVSCSTCQNTTATPTSSSNYVVTGTDIHGCVNTDTVHVNVQTITTSAVDNGGNICDDSTFQLLAYGAQTYVWHPSATLDDPNIANPVASPHSTITYTVLAYEGSCPPDSHTVKVVVFPKPIVNAGGDQTIVAGANAMLNATGSNIATFTWSPAITLSCITCSNPTATPKSTTAYRVLATSNYGCKNADTVTIYVLCDQSQLFVPNTFSPNGDGQNDVFFPRGEGLKYIKSFRIYNRWGEKVFEKTGIQLNDEANGWDGKYKGKDLSPDTYVYAIDGECESGEIVSWKGDVTLIR